MTFKNRVEMKIPEPMKLGTGSLVIDVHPDPSVPFKIAIIDTEGSGKTILLDVLSAYHIVAELGRLLNGHHRYVISENNSLTETNIAITEALQPTGRKH